jgi:hypothetical protein
MSPFRRIASLVCAVFFVQSAESSGQGQWIEQTTGGTVAFTSIWGTSSSDIWAVGYNGAISHWDGRQWTVHPSGTTARLMAVWGYDEEHVWVVGEGGLIRFWDGSAWTTQSSPTTFYLHAVWGTAPNNVWAAGVGGYIVHWDGNAWSVQVPGGGNGLGGLWGSDSNNVWTVGGNGTIKKWNGQTWTTQVSGTSVALQDVWGTDANNVWAVSSSIVRWNGSQWAPMSAPNGGQSLYAVWGADANNVWVAGFNGTLLKWNGSSWANQSTNQSFIGYGLWGTDANNVWLAGTAGTILKYVTPPVVTTGSAKAPTPSGVPLTGTANSNGAAGSAYFEWGQTTAYGNTTLAYSIGAGTIDVPVEIAAPLLPGNTYHYRLVVSNAVGVTYGADAVVRPNSPPSPIDDLIHAPPLPGAFNLQVLSNDTDPDGDALSISGVTNGAKGSTTINGPYVAYTPGPDYDGNDSFTYTVSDNLGGYATATVRLANALPQVADESLHPPPGGDPQVLAVLANDLDQDAEDVLTIVAVTQGNAGSVTTNGTTVTYTPGPSYEGSDTFTYTVADGRGGSATGTVLLSNSAPIPHNDSLHAPATLGSFEINVLENDVDPDSGDSISIVAVTHGDSGTVTTDGQTITYTPGAGYDGNDTFYYWISDGRDVATTQVSNSRRGSVSITNLLPSAADDTAQTTRTSISIDVLANDTDSDGDAPLSIAGVTQGKVGSVAIEDGKVTYTPGLGFKASDSFTYEVTDGRGGRVQSSVHISLAAVVTDEVLATGDAVPGEPDGTMFSTFGTPSLNSSGEIAVVGKFTRPSDHRVLSGIYAGLSLQKIARAAEDAPGVPDAEFKSFKDPIINEAGRVAFQATLSKVPASGDSGVWSNVHDGTLRLVARKGDAAPGTNGAKFSKFLSIALPDTNGPVLVATLSHRPGINARNDSAVWTTGSDGALKLLLRKGDLTTIAGTLRTVKDIALFADVSGSPGQRRGFASNGDLLLRLSFTDTTQSLVRANGAGELLELARSRTEAGGIEFASFGIGTLSDSGEATFKATVLPTSPGAKVPKWSVVARASESGVLQQLSPGDSAFPPIEGALLKSIQDPVAADDGTFAFVAKMESGAGGVTVNNDTVLCTGQPDGAISVRLREGDSAPGITGSKMSGFLSIALIDRRGLAFVGSVSGERGEVTKLNDRGLWAEDRNGELQLLVREGASLEVNGTPKKVKSFTVLSAVTGSPSQGHSYTANGGFAYRTLFTDGSQAILAVWVP